MQLKSQSIFVYVQQRDTALLYEMDDVDRAVRRSQKAPARSNTVDDKKLQATLKRLHVTQVPSMLHIWSDTPSLHCSQLT